MIPFFTSFGSACAGRAPASTSHRKRSAAASAVDQFRGSEPPRFWEQRHPVVRFLGLAGKNLAGILIVALGVVMALPGVPGRGLLLILIGLTVSNFPGKRGLERRLIRRHAISRGEWVAPPLRTTGAGNRLRS